MHWSKTIHLLVEINNYVVEGLIDTGGSMSVMAAAIIRELGLMYLVTKFRPTKLHLKTSHKPWGVDEVLVKVGGVQCTMTFMVV